MVDIPSYRIKATNIRISQTTNFPRTDNKQKITIYSSVCMILSSIMAYFFASHHLEREHCKLIRLWWKSLQTQTVVITRTKFIALWPSCFRRNQKNKKKTSRGVISHCRYDTYFHILFNRLSIIFTTKYSFINVEPNLKNGRKAANRKGKLL